jgi:hypothetical protein
MEPNAVAQRFSIGRTLKDSVKIFIRNLILFGAIAIMVRALLLLLPKGPDVSTLLAGGAIDWWRQLLAIALGIVILSVTRAAVVLGTFRNLRGEKASIADSVQGLRFVPLLLAAGVIINLPAVAATFERILLPQNAVAIGVGGFLSGIITLVFILMWWLYAPAIAIEKAGLFQALSRSRHLLRGRRWHIFGLLCTVGIAASVIAWGVALVAGIRMADLASVGPTTPVGVAIFFASALMSAFDSVLVTTVYYYLRIEKEGLITSDLAQVFD